MSIDILTPSSTFTQATVAADNISITKDSRYTDQTVFDFNKGVPINYLDRSGVPNSYEWAYNNNYPVVKAVNAVNRFKESLQPATISNSFSFYVGGSAGSTSGTLTATFNQTQVGNITVSLPSLGVAATANATFTLTGPSNKTITLCNAGPGGPSCGTTANSVTFANMPVGQYTLSGFVGISNFPSFTFSYSLSYFYMGTQIAIVGEKEFFHESFEFLTSANVVTAAAHTGLKYWNANYTNSFVMPNSKTYEVQWYQLITGKWVLKSQAYTNGMVLTGPVDDVRIFPQYAFLNTYTYKPVQGITSETDPTGRTVYYDYDALQRLKTR